MAPAVKDDYDSLTREEREAKDRADRAREAAEQAGLFPEFLRSIGQNIDTEQLSPINGSRSWGK